MRTDPFDDDLLKLNKNVHDILAPLYERRHPEIFNPTEQHRIRELLQSLLGTHIKGVPRVLDFGAGTGNLTRQLLELGATVVSADVSEGILRELLALTGKHPRLETKVLNGRDLAGVKSDCFDMITAYSVLHHVPDYLRIIDEFVRVLKPGGIIYIDHEVCPSYWEDKTEYLEYCLELSEVKKTQTDNKFKMLKELLSRKGCWRYIWATLSLNGKQIVDDGDIHVQKDDHIEWMAIREHLEPFCEIMEEEDYLVCRETHDPPLVWSRWRALCVDMRLFVARKR